MDEPPGHWTKLNEPGIERQMLHDLIYITNCLKKINLEQKVEW